MGSEAEILLSRMDQILKFKGLRSEDDGSHFFLEMNFRTFLANHFLGFFSLWERGLSSIEMIFWSAFFARTTMMTQECFYNHSPSLVLHLHLQKLKDSFQFWLWWPRPSLSPWVKTHDSTPPVQNQIQSLQILTCCWTSNFFSLLKTSLGSILALICNGNISALCFHLSCI